MPEIDNPKLQTVGEDGASEITGFSKRTLQNRRYLGLPPAYIKSGRKVRYRISDLLAFLDTNTKQPNV